MLKKAFFYITHWEDWHWLAKYIPLIPVWLWYCLRSRSFWFFTPSNPTLTFGGFLGETKREMYEQLPPSSYPKSIYISADISFATAIIAFQSSGLSYPCAVKPDVGMMGFMFRKIVNEAQLEEYHNAMPCDYIVQELIDYPMEVSVFYYRYPGQVSGKITGFLKKEFLEVVGDGTSTLSELIKSHPRLLFRQEEMRSKHQPTLHKILPDGERYCLSYALNLSRGGKLISLEHEKDDRLLKVFDRLSLYTEHFYYGRFDIKCTSVEDLKAGRNFSILEFNGSGAEPHHVYGNGNSLLRAQKILVGHWSMLYKISKENHRAGVKYWTYKEGAAFSKKAKRHFKVLKKLDSDFAFSSSVSHELVEI